MNEFNFFSINTIHDTSFVSTCNSICSMSFLNAGTISIAFWFRSPPSRSRSCLLNDEKPPLAGFERYLGRRRKRGALLEALYRRS